MKVLYQTAATSLSGREGKTSVANSPLSFDMAHPTELGGSGKGANPEQLFAAGYSTCFHSAILHVVKTRKIKLTSSVVDAEVSLLDDNGGFAIGVNLTAVLGGVDSATADSIIAEAHTVCPYSKATMGNITVTLSAKVID